MNDDLQLAMSGHLWALCEEASAQQAGLVYPVPQSWEINFCSAVLWADPQAGWSECCL